MDHTQALVDVNLLPREKLRAQVPGPHLSPASIIPPEAVLGLKGERSWYGPRLVCPGDEVLGE